MRLAPYHGQISSGGQIHIPVFVSTSDDITMCGDGWTKSPTLVSEPMDSVAVRRASDRLSTGNWRSVHARCPLSLPH